MLQKGGGKSNNCMKQLSHTSPAITISINHWIVPVVLHMPNGIQRTRVVPGEQ